MNTIKNYIKNLIGWKTNRKIAVFSIDDYGNVRIASKEAKYKLEKKGLNLSSFFDQYDALETKDDLSALYEVLSSVKDKNGNFAVFTVFALPANINFEKMAENNFKKYFYELLPETYEKLSLIDPIAYNGTWELWKEGMNNNLIHPESHGREHFNLKVFNDKLFANDFELLTALKNRSLPGFKDTGLSTVTFSAAFKFWDFEENNNLKEIIISGLKEFEKVFGFRASNFNSPGGPAHSSLYSTLFDNGINYIDETRLKSEHQGFERYKKKLFYTGKKNKYNQIFLVRNCIFEPNIKKDRNWVDYTYKQVEAAFNLKSPAIISSHRANFCGHIDSDNRKRGLDNLRKLLRKLVSKFPDVEFMTSIELGALIRNKVNFL